MDPIDQQEADETRKVLSGFFGSAATNWPITSETYNLLGEVITKSKTCTKAMHLVPRPWGMGNAWRYATKQVRQALIRYLRTPEGEHYLICMKTTALAMRSRFEMLAHGI